jgi:hypothetical protein
MFDRVMNHRGFHVQVLVAMSALLAGCASVQNTPKQDYVWAMWDQCKATDELRTSTMVIGRVDPDGKYWSNVTVGPGEMEWPKVQACMNEQFKARPYLDWLKGRQASAQPSTGAVATTVASPALSGPITVPIWKVGDEWEYAYKEPSGGGTYVWAVTRIEALDGVEHYVITSGTRESLYRVSDLAISVQRTAGVIMVRDVPPRTQYAWPLTVGKTWEQSYREERPVARQTSNPTIVWTAESEETVTVPAGTFRTVKITSRNKATSAVGYDIWYSPDVKQWVKSREVLTNGVRERELVAFKLR